jgi:chemotaxis protein MotB
MQTPAIIASVIAALLLFLLLYVYFGQLSPTSNELEQLREEQSALQSEIDDIEQQNAELLDALKIELVEELYFESGSAHLSDENRQKLDGILNRLQGGRLETIRVVGHTDDQMIDPEFPRVYATNWELSVHRATSVVRYLESAGIAPERMGVAGMSKYNPTTSNETSEGKAKNRRVEIFLMPERQ